MKERLKLASTSVATFAMVVAFGVVTLSEAGAGEFCIRDVAGHMTGCGFDNMAQCQAAASGIGGDCFRDPFVNDSNKNAYAYSPKTTRSKRASPTAGAATNSSN